MKKDYELKGKYNIFFRWPLVLSLILIALSVVLFFVNKKACVISVLFLILYIVIAVLIDIFGRRNLITDMIDFSRGYDRMSKDLVSALDLPYALIDDEGFILWANDRFQKGCGDVKYAGKKIFEFIPELTKNDIPIDSENTSADVTFGGVYYGAVLSKADASGLADQKIIDLRDAKTCNAVYLIDETEVRRLARINEDNKIVCGIIAIDNYDEALENVEEVRQSLLLALVDRKISKYFSDYDGVLKKFEKERYMFVVKKTSFNDMMESKFSLLEDVKDVKIGNEMAVTLSMGIGLNQGSFVKDLDAAQASIEMALSRGGDQVIVRDNEKVTFHGGRSGGVEKYTRVKARVKAHALREILQMKSKAVIMGHKITDVDALGAAIGIRRACETLGKPAHIVIDKSSIYIQRMVEEFKKDETYEEGVFIDGNTAKQMVDDDTALIVVDTNRPSYTECRELLDKTEAIVVLDHHRQGEEVIKNARLSYIEPYASSACEMAAEILQYFAEDVRLRPVEADCLYAGILVDTDYFVTRTGVRTFEAAAFLRRNGADVTRVRKLFRESIDDYKAKAKTISEAELYMDAYAISVCDSKGLESPTIVCAQAANELLNVTGVKASFVMTEYNGLVYVSARAIDEVNVQLIMERLGGGGHINMAGTQFEDMSIEEVGELLRKTIREMAEEGDI